jgi:hypothetical protein
MTAPTLPNGFRSSPTPPPRWTAGFREGAPEPLNLHPDPANRRLIARIYVTPNWLDEPSTGANSLANLCRFVVTALEYPAQVSDASARTNLHATA